MAVSSSESLKKNNDKFWHKPEMRKKMTKKVRLDIQW